MGLRSLRGGKIISNFLTYVNNIAVILHVLSGDGWKEKPKLLAENFLQLKSKYYGDITKNLFYVLLCTAGQAVAQLVEALLYKREGRGFDY